MMIGNYKIFENLQKSKKLLNDLNIPETNESFQKLKDMLKNNLGYIGTFTKWLLKDRESFERLEDVYKKLQEINNLDRPVDSFEKLEDLYDYLQEFEIDRKVKQVIKSLPSRTRQLVNDELKNLIKLNSEDIIIKSIKDFYSKKGGRYKDIESLVKDTRDFIKNIKGGFNSETIKKKIDEENLNVEIIVDTPELLMVRVKDYIASKAIGSKHWCISTSESMWNYYVNDFTNQYFIYDFTKDISDKKHMIGTTISPRGKVTSGHFADDSSINDLTYLDSL